MTNDELPQRAAMNDRTNGNQEKREYDLEKRTAKFGESVIFFARLIPRDPVSVPLISQFVDSGTSVGANYCEADDAISKRDFRHKISICKKEARETKYWLRMIVAAVPELRIKARILWKEANELHLIFAAIWRRCKIDKDPH
jgi:four helix bundle protein